MNQKRVLPISRLQSDHPGLSPGTSLAMEEAASVCMSRHHQPPRDITIVDNNNESNAIVEWELPSARVLAAHANEIDATESGAYAVALAAVKLERNLHATRRAETLSGADYLLSLEGEAPDDLESHVRLEVSGIDQGNDSSIKSRLRSKLSQTRKGKSLLPAIAAVVGFLNCKVVLQDAENGT